jgi:transcriptional regulator with XRE-family HTH domain
MTKAEVVVDERRGVLARVGWRVRKAREAQGLTRNALAGRCGTSHHVIAYIEEARRGVSVVTLARIARALDVPLWYLVTDVDEAL